MQSKIMRENIKEIINNHFEDFVKALIEIEKKIDDEDMLNEIYEEYVNNNVSLLNHDFDLIIEKIEKDNIIKNIRRRK